MQTRLSQRLFFFLLLAGLMVLGACQQRAPQPVSDPAITQPAPPEPAPEPNPEPAPEPAPLTPAEPLLLTVLVSDDEDEYSSVADALTEFAGAERIQRIDLGGRPDVARAVLEQLRADGAQSVVAIGLLAALAARELEDSQVVFCQVVNHAEHDLLRPNTRGICAFPCLRDPVRTWKNLGAELKTIGVITSSGHEESIERVTKQWKPLDVTVRHEIANSDQEMLVTLRKMLPEIDGYWLLPDNRVLSRDALRQLMSMARRSGVGVLVHDDQLLEYGSLISVTSDPDEIAEVIYDQLLLARELGSFPGEGVLPIYRSRIRVHAQNAQQMGLKVDELPESNIAR